ncbi:hypothetical protein TNCV_934371 [Trichonephila clavipes]|nr:hypothetical protein TNCV_934371 [Trichonephila clavipes]
MTGTLPPFLDFVVGGGTPERSSFHAYGSKAAVHGCASVGHASSDCSLDPKALIAHNPILLTQKHAPILLQPLIPVPKPTMASRIPRVTKSSTSSQAHLLLSTSSVAITTSESQQSIPIIATAPTTFNNVCTSVASSLFNKAIP